jgi:hypothetical protein
MRQSKTDEFAGQNEVQYCPNLAMYIRRLDGVKVTDQYLGRSGRYAVERSGRALIVTHIVIYGRTSRSQQKP